jgi:hypothetical protein
MGKEMRKKWLVPILPGLLLMTMTACSAHKAEAEPVLEAASTEWTEGETARLGSKLSSVEQRAAKLEAEVNALLGTSPGVPGGGTAKPPAEPPVNPPTSGAEVFKDVGTDYWAFKEIMEMYNLGVISGYPDIQKFLPENSITRAQAASMLVKALKLPLSDSPSVFSDVKASDWSRKAIMTVAEKGYFNGSNGKFLPNDPMTRKHMAVVLQRAFELTALNEPYEDYKDVPASNDGYSYIKIVSQHGIARGSDGNYRPSEPTRRSQFSVFLYRALEK